MANLVQTVFFRLLQFALLIKRILFEEIANLVAGLLEILVAELRLTMFDFVRRGEHVFKFGWVELVDHVQRVLAQFFTAFRRDEALQNQDAGFTKISEHFRGELAIRGCCIGWKFVHSPHSSCLPGVS